MRTKLKTTFITACFFSPAPYAGVMGTTMDIPSLYDGFYAGANIGLGNLLDKEQHTVNPESQQFGSLGILGGGFVGYDFTFLDALDLAIEGFGSATGWNINDAHFVGSTSYTAQSHYYAGVRVLPGYQFTPGIQGHVILGYRYAQFRIQDSGNYGYINTSYHKSGFESGLGWTAFLTQGFLLRLDMMYTTYGQSSVTGSGLPGSPPTQTYTNAFSSLQADLSLVYKF